jgi:hypothetical protein
MAVGETKTSWGGIVTSVQPRIRLTRSFDERSHTYQGYVLGVHGSIGEEKRGFLVAMGEGAHRKHQFRHGDQVSGLGLPVADRRLETAELYKVSKFNVIARSEDNPTDAPPWGGVPPEFSVYRERGHDPVGAGVFRNTDSVDPSSLVMQPFNGV